MSLRVPVPPRRRAGIRGAAQPLVLAALAVALLMTLPVLGVVGHLGAGQASTRAVWAHLLDTVLAEAAATSLALGALVVCGSMFVGTGTAWLVTQYDFPGRRWLTWALMLPLAMPGYVAAYAYTDLLQFSGPVQTALREAFGLRPRGYWFPEIRSLPGAAALFVAVLYPYVYALTRPAFLERGPHLVDAARTLGCTPRAVFWRVALPLARPAMIAGGMLALMETLSDFGAVEYFGLPTFTQSLYNAWFNLGDRAAAAQLAVALLAVVAVVVTVERSLRGARRSPPPRCAARPAATGCAARRRRASSCSACCRWSPASRCRRCCCSAAPAARRLAALGRLRPLAAAQRHRRRRDRRARGAAGAAGQLRRAALAAAAGARRQRAGRPGLRAAGLGDRHRRAGAAGGARQRPRRLAARVVRRLDRAAAERHLSGWSTPTWCAT